MSFNDIFPAGEFKKRRQKLRNLLAARGVNAAWIMHHPDVFYFSGTAQNANLHISTEADSVLFVRKFEPRARSESDIQDIRPFSTMSDISVSLNKYYSGLKKSCTVGIEMDVLPLKMFHRFEKAFPTVRWIDISNDIRWVRSSKSPTEIELIRQAGTMLDQTFDQIRSWLVIGMTEIDLAARIECEMRRKGHQGTLPVRAYNSSIHYGNVLFGQNGAIRGGFDGPTCGSGLYRAVPKGAGWARLKAEEPVFIDLVAGIAGYMADATRVFCLGHLPDMLSESHKQCIDIQKAVTAHLTSGIPCSEPYNIAIQTAQAMNLQHVFMGPDNDRAYFIGHGLGLEIDEFPILAPRQMQPIPDDSAVAIEPKVIVEGVGAVGIENTWQISPDGATRLTQYPDECQECALS